MGADSGMSVEWRAWDSRSELEEFLRESSHRMLRRSSESENAFYSVTIQPNERGAAARPLTFGVCSEDHGINPQTLPLPNRPGALIAVDNVVIAVDTGTGDDLFRISLWPSLVYSMANVDGQSKILIFHELGAALIDDTGNTLWNFSRDVVIDSSVEGDVIHLSFTDEPPARLSMHSGLELSD